MLTDDVPPSLREGAWVWAIGAHNCRAAAEFAPHVQFLGS